MTVIAVGGDDVIVFTEQRNSAHSHRFLADVEVEETAHFTALIMLERELLESADADHLPVESNLVSMGQFLIDGSVGVFGRGGGQGGHKMRAEDRQNVRRCK